jgi:NADH-ubiquinone oxidoreductase chain 4
LLPEATLFFTPLIQTLSLISLYYAGMSTIRQTDFKRLIAYSSISHMAIVCLGLFSLNFRVTIIAFYFLLSD